MENFAVTTYHFNPPKTRPVTLSNGHESWSASSVEDIVSKLFGNLADNHISNSHSPVLQVVLIVGDSRDKIQVEYVSSKVHSATLVSLLSFAKLSGHSPYA